MWTKFMHWLRHSWILILIVIIGAVLRLYHLDQLPYGLNRDEAAIAYNAYTLALTGRDEWGRVYPLFLESFGDQKLPVLPYLLAGLFHLHLDNYIPADYLVRLPSAIAGICTIIIVYELIKLIWPAPKSHYHLAALASAVSISFNPVFIWYSRGAWEANLALALFLLAIYMITYWIKNKKNWTVSILTLIFILLLISFFTYNSPLLITTVALPFIIFYGWRRGPQFWAPLFVTCLAAVVVSFSLLTPLTSQKSGITIFSDPTIYHYYIQYRQSLPSILQPFIGNKYLYWCGQLTKNYLASFAPRFWLHGHSHPWHQLEGFGVFYLSTTIIIYISLIYLLGKTVLDFTTPKNWRAKFTNLIHSPYLQLIIIISICLIPSIITTDSPHVTRSLEFFTALVIITSGLIFGELLPRLLKKKNELIIINSLFIILIIETIYYQSAYIGTLSEQNIYYQGISNVLPEIEDNHLTLIRSPERPYEYVKWAWALRLSPELFWTTAARENPDLAGIKAISDFTHFHFADLDYDDPVYPQVIWYNIDTQKWERLR